MSLDKPKRTSCLMKLAKLLAVPVNVALAVSLVFSAYGGTIDPLRTPIGALAAMRFPLLLLVTLIATVANALFFRRLALLNILSVLVCWGPVVTFCPLNFFRPSVSEISESTDKVIKVMTYNVYGFLDYTHHDDMVLDGNSSLEYILETDADIVLCQEGMSVSGIKNSTMQQRDSLRARYPYIHVDDRGMEIFSKYPFERVPLTYSNRWQYDVCLYVVDVDGVRLNLFNLHLQSIGLTPSDKELFRRITDGEAKGEMQEIRHDLISKLSEAFRNRAIQAHQVREFVDSVTGPVLLCGDFNDIPGCYAARVIAGDDMTDAYRAAALGPAITYHADRFYFRIDQMMTRGGIIPLRVWREVRPSSDHYPLIGYFSLTP